MQYKDGL